MRNGGHISTDARALKWKRVEWDGENNVKYMWLQVKRAMVESARGVWGSVRVGGKNPKSVLEQRGKSCSYEKVGFLDGSVGVARDEDPKERCLEVYKEEKKRVERCIYQRRR